MNAAMLSIAPDTAPPARLKQRLLAAIGAKGSESRSPWGWVAALAAAAMLMFAVRTSMEERRAASELADARRTVEQVSAERERLGAERREMMQALSFLNQPDTLQVGFGKDQARPRKHLRESESRSVAHRLKSARSNLGQDVRDVGDPERRQSQAGGNVPIGRVGDCVPYAGGGHSGSPQVMRLRSPSSQRRDRWPRRRHRFSFKRFRITDLGLHPEWYQFESDDSAV